MDMVAILLRDKKRIEDEEKKALDDLSPAPKVKALHAYKTNIKTKLINHMRAAYKFYNKHTK